MIKNKETEQKLNKIIEQHTLSSIGVGLLPVPAIDFIGLMAIQHNLIKEIAEVYQVPFFNEAAKKIVSSLIGRIFLMPALTSMIKFVPLAGSMIGMATMPIACGASTYATGKVFVRHFESGGTFLSFDFEKMKIYYNEMLKEGEEIARETKNIVSIKILSKGES